VCLEAKAWDEAKGYLEDLIARESHDSAHLNLGHCRRTQRPAGSPARIRPGRPGNDYLPAQLRQADILMSNGRTDEAEKRLAAARCRTGLRDPAVSDPGRDPVGQQTGRAPGKCCNKPCSNTPTTEPAYTRAMQAEKRNDWRRWKKTCA
jgi:hypothetical protein